MGCGVTFQRSPIGRRARGRGHSDSDGMLNYFRESNRFFLRLWRSRRAFCLGVIGFTNPPIGKALIASHAKQVFGAFCIADL